MLFCSVVVVVGTARIGRLRFLAVFFSILIIICSILPNVQGNFLIDTTLGRDTIFGVFVEDDENHHIKAVTFRDTEG